MNAIDPQRLVRDAYPRHLVLSTRVSDMDGYGHLNAIRIGHYYEDARARFHNEVFPRDERLRTVVAQLSIRYLGEGFWPGDVEIATGILRLGRSSFEMGQALFARGRCIGLCDTVIVHSPEGKAVPLTPSYRRAIAGVMLREVAAPA